MEETGRLNEISRTLQTPVALGVSPDGEGGVPPPDTNFVSAGQGCPALRQAGRPPLRLQFPPGAIGGVDELVGFVAVGKAGFGGVPFELRSGHFQRDHAQQRDFS